MPLKERWYGITFSTVYEFAMLGDIFYRACPVTEKRDSITHGSYRTPPIMCFCLDIKGHFLPLVPNLRAIVTWSYGERQEKCYNFIT